MSFTKGAKSFSEPNGGGPYVSWAVSFKPCNGLMYYDCGVVTLIGGCTALSSIDLQFSLPTFHPHSAQRGGLEK